MTIAIGIQSASESKVVLALPEAVAGAVFGKQGESLLGIARTACAALLNHLRAGGRLAEWVPPIHGVFLGTVEAGQGNDLNEIAAQALRASACLSAMSGEFQAAQSQPERNSLLTKMRRVMKKTDPLLESNFSADVPVKIRGAEMTIRCDYFSSRLAINLCSLAPGRNLNQQFDAFNTRLCRLDQLKANEALLEYNQETSIILAIPGEDALEQLPQQQAVHTFRDRLLMAQDLAEKRAINITTVLTPESGTEIIIKREHQAA